MNSLEVAKKFLLSKCPKFPNYVAVMGSGLSNLLKEIQVEVEIPYKDIPNMPESTVEGHVGKLVIGKFGKVRVACMQGRLHLYEGYTPEQVVFPVRLLALCGAEIFLLTNASGGIHKDMKPSDLLLITDHINLMGINPLNGPNKSALGPRFPDMTTAYDLDLRKTVLHVAERLGTPLRQGIYLATHGPSYETPAEIRMHKNLGADVVGMSTVPETIALRHMGKRVIGISCITNQAAGVSPRPLIHSEVLESAVKIQVPFANLIKEFFHEVEKTGI